MLQRIRSPLMFVMVIYFAISGLALTVWEVRGVYPPTGDEPHYLVIADALVSDRTTDVGAAYRREIDQPRWYEPGLAPPGSQLRSPSAHVVPTGDGFHSWHGLGVGAVIALPAQVAGVAGARWIMIIVGSGAIIFAWVIAGQLFASPRFRFAATGAVALAYPVLLASTQIFPDIVGGVLLLGLLTWWVTPHARSSVRWTLLTAIGLAAVPWLGSRFIVPGAVGLIALAVANRRSTRLFVASVVPAGVSAVGLMGYHFWAFGSVFGSPSEGALVFGRDFWMLLPGLMLDQNQGWVWANPVLWLSIPGLVLLWRRNRGLFVTWIAIAIALWVPAAAHPGLYGFVSFNGRYGWPLAIMSILPALIALGALSRRSPRMFIAVAGLGALFQAYLVGLSVFVGGTAPGSPAGLDLYTRPVETWLESYSAWWFPFQRMLPAWYNAEWAFTFPPNWVWLVVVGLIVALTVWRLPARRLVLVSGITAGAVVLAGLVGSPGPRFTIQGEDITSVAGRDSVGYPVIGPVELMRFGTYVWSVEYQAPSNDVVGKWELVRVSDDTVVAAGELRGTDGAMAREESVIPVRFFQPHEYLWRIGWYGEHDLTVASTSVRFQ